MKILLGLLWDMLPGFHTWHLIQLNFKIHTSVSNMNTRNLFKTSAPKRQNIQFLMTHSKDSGLSVCRYCSCAICPWFKMACHCLAIFFALLERKKKDVQPYMAKASLNTDDTNFSSQKMIYMEDPFLCSLPFTKRYELRGKSKWCPIFHYLSTPYPNAIQLSWWIFNKLFFSFIAWDAKQGLRKGTCLKTCCSPHEPTTEEKGELSQSTYVPTR